MLSTTPHTASTKGSPGEGITTALRFRGWLLVGILGVLGLNLGGVALAQDTFGLGDGHSGSLQVGIGQTVVQSGFYALGRNALPGDTLLQIASNTVVPARSLVLLIRMSGVPGISGDATPVYLNRETVGLWELARVIASREGILTLSAPVRGNYPARRSQLVMVPEYTDVTIASTGTLLATPWDGATGGIVAFLVQGAIRNDGEISASGLGFRGGPFIPFSAPSVSPFCAENEFDIAAPQGGLKGEGLANELPDLRAGRGNIANAGGGGNCSGSGGGGGGSVGQGGRGGFSPKPVQPLGGLGGSSVRFTPSQRVVMGGGGGAGQGTGAGTSGAAGGGIILIRALTLTGNGLVSANGLKADDANSGGGAGGGGAGGSIYIRVAGPSQCGAVQSNGGSGGNHLSPREAPGGGGGGGAVFFQASELADCHLEALGGSAGSQPDPIDGSHGATPVLSHGFESPHTGRIWAFLEAYDPTAGLPSEDAGVDRPNLPLDGGTMGGCEPNCEAFRHYRVGWGCNSGLANPWGWVLGLFVATALALRRNRPGLRQERK